MEHAQPPRRWRSRRRVVAAGGVAIAALAGGTAAALASFQAAPAHPATHTAAQATSVGSTGPASSTTSSLATTSTTATSVAPRAPGIGMGDSGPAVQALQQRLADLKFDPGTIDGQYGLETWQAVVAFQKTMGLARTGRATPDVLNALPTATAPAPLVPAGGANRVEIDLPRQILMLYEGGQLVRTMMISSGGGYRYCVDNQCDIAVTPGGSYHVFYKFLGEQTDKLGQLYNPLYFNGGIAIHGEPAVPLYPASHGCVRIPMSESIWFFNRVPVGEPVYVVGGAQAPVPFNAAAPNGQSPATNPAPVPTTAPRPTTTTAPPPKPTTTVPPPTTTTPPSTTTTTRPATTSTTA
jgi:peptidoglycan hydrolase-like protein with peptidoglycan-binding domain